MSDLIRREDAVEAIYEALRTPLPNYHNDFFHDSMSIAMAMANNIPSAESERTAKVKEGWGLAMCCACKKRVFPNDKYCSHCGARLEWI